MDVQAITAHEGPLTPKHPNYNGSKYKVLVQWEDGSVTCEPLDISGKDDPVSCAQYDKDNNLLEVSQTCRNSGESISAIITAAVRNS